MRNFARLAYVAAAAAGFAGGPALANSCQAEKMMCATAMPVGGYCECTAHGMTMGGTVVAGPGRGRADNATAGGCGAHPQAPGCH
jgi:hypothetical protein